MRYVDLKALGKLAKEIREKAGLNQSEAAARIGSTQSNVSSAERGKGTRYIRVALNIIEQIGGQHLEGPYYVVREKPQDYDVESNGS
jgi:transcriptional regulator with XRE-family HTH domain